MKTTGVHTVTYYVNVYIYREILFYVNVIICAYYISLIYRTEHSPMIIGEVVLSIYKKEIQNSPMIIGEVLLSSSMSFLYIDRTTSPMIIGE